MIYGNAFLSVSIATVFYLIGTSLFVFYNKNNLLMDYVNQDQVFATYIINELPIGISGLLLARIISIIVGIISILIAMILSNSELKSSYEWFNSFMGLILGIL